MSVFQVTPFLAYVAVAHPATYKLTRKLLGNWVANSDGLASMAGVALHAVVFVLLTSLLMNLLVPRISGAAPVSPSPSRRPPSYAASTVPMGTYDSNTVPVTMLNFLSGRGRA